MSREEAAAKANYEAVTGKPWEKATERAAKLCREDSVAIIKAADAHDQANGIHRIALDDATVERAARALFVIENPEADWEALPLNQWVTDIYRKRARVVLAAAMEGSGE